jgi:ornithine--oxo-acid transaminase
VSRAFRTPALGPFLEKLVQLTGMDKVLPANGGVESVEAAVKAARRWGYRVKKIGANQANIVVARGNFHGRTTAVVGFSSEKEYRADFGPFAPGFRDFEFGDIDSLRGAIDADTCAVLMEPIQGEAGIRVPPQGFCAPRASFAMSAACC